MIRITVELLPLGDKNRSTVLGEAVIANDGTGTGTKGNYKYRIRGKSRILKGGTGNIEGFKRERDNVWELLRLALNQMHEERVPKLYVFQCKYFPCKKCHDNERKFKNLGRVGFSTYYECLICGEKQGNDLDHVDGCKCDMWR